MNVFGGDNYAAECQGDCTGTCERCELKRLRANASGDRIYSDALIGFMVRQVYQGKSYRRKETAERGPGISCSFSCTVLEWAGGWQKFLDEWEEDPYGR